MAIRADVQPDIRFSRTLAGGGGKPYLGDFRAVHGLPVVQYSRLILYLLNFNLLTVCMFMRILYNLY